LLQVVDTYFEKLRENGGKQMIAKKELEMR
jgi:hypothetical protein